MDSANDKKEGVFYNKKQTSPKNGEKEKKKEKIMKPRVK